MPSYNNSKPYENFEISKNAWKLFKTTLPTLFDARNDFSKISNFKKLHKRGIWAIFWKLSEKNFFGWETKYWVNTRLGLLIRFNYLDVYVQENYFKNHHFSDTRPFLENRKKFSRTYSFEFWPEILSRHAKSKVQVHKAPLKFCYDQPFSRYGPKPRLVRHTVLVGAGSACHAILYTSTYSPGDSR